ncbi:MAG: polysaccharide pyruvyl transferase CsaB [Bacillota bacterium]
MARVVISGYYGFNNVGDEAILIAMKEALLRQDPSLEITVLSANPQLTESQYGLRAVGRADLFPVLKALREADLLISGGGSLLQDVTSHRSLRYYLSIMTLARMVGCPVMLYAQGIGPIGNSYNRWLTRFVLNRVALVTVRDAASADELRSLGVERPPVHVTADPVVALPPAATEVGAEILRQAGVELEAPEPLVGVSVRAWPGREHLTTEAAEALDRLIERERVRLVFIPMHFPEDLEMTNSLRRVMRHGDETKVLSNRYHAQELLSAVGHLDLLVAVRLHALIFAAVMNVPAVAISYDPKVDRFADLVGQPLAGSYEQMSGEELYQAMARTLSERQAIKQKLAVTVADLQAAALQNARLAAGLLQSRAESRVTRH